METKMVYTVAETAELLGVSRNTVYRLIKDGTLKAKKIGSMKIPRKALERLLEEEEERNK